MKIYLVVLVAFSLYTCKREKNDKQDIYYYHSEVVDSPNKVIIDTVSQSNILKIEEHISIRKDILDSLIKNRLINQPVSVGDLNIVYVDSYKRMFANQPLDIYKFDFSNIKKGYFVTILFCQQYSILIKNYYGHGVVYLDSIRFDSGRKDKDDFSSFSKKLMLDDIIFKKLSEPPPLPDE